MDVDKPQNVSRYHAVCRGIQAHRQVSFFGESKYFGVFIRPSLPFFYLSPSYVYSLSFLPYLFTISFIYRSVVMVSVFLPASLLGHKSH